MERVTLSTGVILELRAPSQWAFIEAQRQIAKRKPQPPLALNQEKGRQEPNENDPVFAAAISQWERDLVEQLYDIGIVTGTTVIDPLPIPGPESTDLDDLLTVLRIEPAKSQKGRYLQWLKYLAAPTAADITAIITPLLRIMGTSEADVARATESFRSDEGWPADNGNRAQRRHPERDTVRPDVAGAGANLRGTGDGTVLPV